MNAYVARCDLASCGTRRMRATLFRRIHRLCCTVLHKHIMPGTVVFSMLFLSFHRLVQLYHNSWGVSKSVCSHTIDENIARGIMQSKKRDEKGLRVSENVSVCRDNQQVRNMPEQQHNEAENNIRRPVVFSLPVLRHDVQKGHETPFPYPRL